MIVIKNDLQKMQVNIFIEYLEWKIFEKNVHVIFYWQRNVKEIF